MVLTIEDGGVVSSHIESNAITSSGATVEMQIEKPIPPTVEPEPKISVALLQRDTPMVDVLIRYVDEVRIPRMPRLQPDEPKESVRNMDALNRAALLIQGVQADRAEADARHRDSVTALGGKVTSQFWLFSGLTASVPRDQLEQLAQDPEIRVIGPDSGGSLSSATIADGRSILNSDPYFSTSGLSSGYNGLIDSGLRATHQVITGKTSWVRDCVDGLTSNCSVAGSGLTLNANDVLGHGTAVADIMMGTTALGNSYRGVTGLYVDSYRVVADPGHYIDYGAVGRAYRAAIAGLDDVINASFDCYNSVCSDAADGAFDSGSVVIASMGNNDAGSHVSCPGNGRKVLAVGAIDSSQNTAPYSDVGPSTDGRTKPDVMALGTDVLIAYNSSDSATLSQSGTSMSSPFVAGAASLMRRWLHIGFPSMTIEPGHVMPMLLVSGNNTNSPIYSDTIGAGTVIMPTGSGTEM